MKVVFCSNFFNHHQLYISKELYHSKDIEYIFIATENIPEERLKLGYKDMNQYPYIVRAYENEEEKNRALKLCNECDVLIIGSAPNIYIEDRLEKNKLTFRYSERIFKTGKWRVFNPKIYLSIMKNHTRYRENNIYMLSSSAYTPLDYSLVGAYKNKCFKWGYFPETKNYNIEELISNKEKNEVIEILWVARFIDWKHPEYPVDLAKELKDAGYKFKIKMIGTGYLEEQIKRLINKFQLNDCIDMVGPVASDKVRNYMEQANIFIATSDQNEGWGAVVNEAMNSGCAVVANKKIGAVPYLIQDNKNGMIYKNKKQFIQNVIFLINNDEERNKMGANAYETIANIWNAKNAVKNFLELVKSIQKNEGKEIENGPCSKAPIIWG